MSQTMHAAAIDHFGGPETISFRTLPMPEPGPDEVLIRIESAGVGVWDPFEREGGFAKWLGVEPKFPYVLGSDGAGTVAAVGENVTRFKKGDRVYAGALMNPKGGFYAEFIALNARNVAPIPGNLSIEEAGVMPFDAITALQGLEELDLKQGESVMIFGASGGIGHLAVQLARRMGTRVFAVASGEDGVELVRRLGADAVVDGKKDDIAVAARKFAPNGLDAALITAGGKTTDQALTAMRADGRIAYPSGVEPAPNPPGVRCTRYDGTPSPAMIEKLNHLIEAGPFAVHVGKTFPLSNAADAHKALEGHHRGKFALKPQ